MRVEVKVLGPLEVSVADVSVVPSASKPSQLLAMLALKAGHVVTVSELTEEIWGYRPPRTGLPTLHTYILKLRRKLQVALEGASNDVVTPKDVLVTRRSGYLLDVDPEDVDAVRYERLSAAGRRAVNADDHRAASEILGQALSLWRGPAFSDLPTGPVLGVEAIRLEETRLGDIHLRIEAELWLGRHHQLLGELATLCARHPLMENFCAQHMVALYRSGRQSQAMDAFRRLRTTMVEQLGVEPSPRLRQLQHAILNAKELVDDPYPGFGVDRSASIR